MDNGIPDTLHDKYIVDCALRTPEQRTVPAEHFVWLLALNVDNERLSDAEFRQFVRNSLPIVVGVDPDEPVYVYDNQFHQKITRKHVEYLVRNRYIVPTQHPAHFRLLDPYTLQDLYGVVSNLSFYTGE